MDVFLPHFVTDLADEDKILCIGSRYEDYNMCLYYIEDFQSLEDWSDISNVRILPTRLFVLNLDAQSQFIGQNA